jgi:hypothetical protein
LKHSLDHLERIEGELLEVEAEIRRRMEPYAVQIQR